MNRQIVSFLMMPCVLLAQSVVAFGHVHGGVEPAGHQTRAHVHFGIAHSGHTHGHHHGHHGHQHHHEDCGDTSEQPNVPSSPCSGHDSDAFYVDGVAADLCRQTSGENELTVSFSAAGLESKALFPQSATSSHRVAHRIHGPPPDDDCPTYLLLSTLLL